MAKLSEITEHMTTLLDELWTDAELWDAHHCLTAIYEGTDVNLTPIRMKELANRGLVHSVIRLPGRGKYAGRFKFQWHDKLASLVLAAKAAGFYDAKRTNDDD